MLSFETNEQIDNLLDAYTKADKDSRAQLSDEINNELEVFLSKESTDEDAKDGLFGFLRDLSDSVQEEFYKLLPGDSNKKRFVRALSRYLLCC